MNETDLRWMAEHSADPASRAAATQELLKREHNLKIAQALSLRAAGQSLYAIATELGVSKDWLRTYAGLS